MLRVWNYNKWVWYVCDIIFFIIIVINKCECKCMYVYIYIHIYNLSFLKLIYILKNINIAFNNRLVVFLTYILFMFIFILYNVKHTERNDEYNEKSIGHIDIGLIIIGVYLNIVYYNIINILNVPGKGTGHTARGLDAPLSGGGTRPIN